MTKRRLMQWVIMVLSLYLLSIIGGVILRIYDRDGGLLLYSTFKDLIPFFIAIPAAWLGYCFSRRLAYLQQLRGLWSEINEAVQNCIQYTYLDEPTVDQFGSVVTKMKRIIDEIRGPFKNIGEKPGRKGLYPFEEIKQIKDMVVTYGYGSKDKDTRRAIRHNIVEKWKIIREPFLSEFDREHPTYFSSPYTE